MECLWHPLHLPPVATACTDHARRGHEAGALAAGRSSLKWHDALLLPPPKAASGQVGWKCLWQMVMAAVLLLRLLLMLLLHSSRAALWEIVLARRLWRCPPRASCPQEAALLREPLRMAHSQQLADPTSSQLSPHLCSSPMVARHPRHSVQNLDKRPAALRTSRSAWQLEHCNHSTTDNRYSANLCKHAKRTCICTLERCRQDYTHHSKSNSLANKSRVGDRVDPACMRR
mmetsp:Transcript_22292/g.57083  ORF Transcript_22292/g.57083 Transcript_22292/m.57083 type:complete len:230 (-) Transcript_22292:1261-1950(-)